MSKDYLDLRIKKIIPQTPEAITLFLEPVNGEPVEYKAGQFLTLSISIGNKELRRSYSFSSTPGIDPDVAITIKRVENGEVSRYVMSHAKEGDLLKALYPAGRFTLNTDRANKRDIVFIGAGSGITPLYSLLKYVLSEEPQSHIILINSNKNEQTALFYQQLEKLATHYADRFSLHNLFSNPTLDSQVPVRLNIGLLQTLVNNYIKGDRAKAQFYVCGPPHFMRMVNMTLVFMEFSKDQIHQEIFFTEELPQVAFPVATDGTPKQVALTYRSATYVLEVPPNKFILKSALEKGIQLPYSCMGGVCSTCVAKCTSGTVQMAINKVLTDKEVASGLILTCVSYPVSDKVVIEVG